MPGPGQAPHERRPLLPPRRLPASLSPDGAAPCHCSCPEVLPASHGQRGSSRLLFPAPVCCWHTADLAASLSLSFCTGAPATGRPQPSGLQMGAEPLVSHPHPSGPWLLRLWVCNPGSCRCPGGPRFPRSRAQARLGAAPRLGGSSDLLSRGPRLTLGSAIRHGPGSQVHNLATGWSPARGQQAWPR